MDEVSASYQPGVCNINTAEIAKRRKLGHIGLTVFVILLIIILLLSINRYYRIILFLPAMLAANGYLQAHNHFCVGYARTGMQNANEGSTKASQIADKSALAQDKRKARVMNLQSAAIAALATAIVVCV